MEHNGEARLPENKMGIMPVNRLLLSMAVPMMISMLVQALYNIVDSMFVSQVSENALTAVSLAFPAQNLMISVAVGTGVGVNALLSRSLGEKNYERVNQTASHAVFLALCSYAVFAVLGIFFSRLYFSLQSNIPEVVDMGVEYLTICTVLSFGMFGQITFERLLQSTGKTLYTMFTQGLGAVINIIFDPILIFGLFGFPQMGVAGAAAATVLGQIIAFFVGMAVNQLKNPEVKLSFRGFRPRGRIVRGIYAVGLPSIVMSSISSVMTFGMNQILGAFSSTAQAVFGVYFKLQSFVFMPVFGLNNGMVPIVAYNLGAKKGERITKTVKLSVLYAVGIMLIGLAVFQLLPDRLLAIFEASPYMLEIGVPALRIISVNFIFAGYGVVCSSLFQSLGHGILSLLISLLRQLVVILPAAYLLARTGVLDNVWLAFPLSEIVSVAVSTVFLRYAYRREIHPLMEEKA